MTTVGTWEPGAAPPTAPDVDFLWRAIALCRAGQLEEIESALSAADQRDYAALMRLDNADGSAWEAAATHFDAGELQDLIRFFTIAEMRLPGWRGDARSPVIALARVLRRSGAPPDRELMLWIRAQSDNRYLPWGAVPG